MTKFLGGIIPFLILHLFCCGALLGILITTGYLFLLRQEGQNKIFLLPAIAAAILFFWLHRRHHQSCEIAGGKTLGDHFVGILLYLVFSLVLGTIFIVYIFVPWWIPGYKGGILLP